MCIRDRAKGTGGRAREDGLGLLLARDATGLLATSLVEPGPHAAGTGVTLMC